MKLRWSHGRVGCYEQGEHGTSVGPDSLEYEIRPELWNSYVSAREVLSVLEEEICTIVEVANEQYKNSRTPKLIIVSDQ